MGHRGIPNPDQLALTQASSHPCQPDTPTCPATFSHSQPARHSTCPAIPPDIQPVKPNSNSHTPTCPEEHSQDPAIRNCNILMDINHWSRSIKAQALNTPPPTASQPHTPTRPASHSCQPATSLPAQPATLCPRPASHLLPAQPATSTLSQPPENCTTSCTGH
ncbi:uncharacterized protein LOC127002558 [Eriocheir sinensis]|uniref:uncharacterized protein LOC127002558 n=1 Tax=Eriocheir sinensis TaxID=95602 RepID=UPI0021C9706B|nr:uncharacterized protein LOC127002558 [Eriocheir sinensis]